MPRKPRVIEPNVVYHVFNRRTDCQLLFPSPRAFDDFVHLLAEGVERYDAHICAYCVMETHWHQGIWVRDPDAATAVANFLRWLSSSHATRFRFASGTRGRGHVYQDRYTSLPVRSEDHYLTLVRYIEANPLAAGLVTRAEHWPWSSLTDRLSGRRRIAKPGPVALPRDWVQIVNARSTIELSEDQESD